MLVFFFFYIALTDVKKTVGVTKKVWTMQPICSLVVRKKTSSAYNKNGKAQLTIFQWKYLVQ